MTLKLVAFLAVGTVLMGVPIIRVAKEYDLRTEKALALTILLTITGTLGTYLMYYAENGNWGGLSFFGAVFLVPIVFLAVSFILQVPYGEAMDLCAIGECIMLALMKIHCMLGGCCKGRLLFVTQSGTEIIFPSRPIELVVALILFYLLYRWAISRKRTSELYAWYLLLYGGTRFVLNFLRADTKTIFFGMAVGGIWALCAVVIGATCLLTRNRFRRKLQ